MMINESMRKFVHSETMADHLQLELEDIANQGFSIYGDCYLMCAFYNLSRGERSDFPDATGYECFYNSVNIGDYVGSDLVPEAIGFMKRIFSVWNATYSSIKLVGILSLGEFDATVRFHLARPNENWLGQNLNEYDDPILVTDSMDVDFH